MEKLLSSQSAPNQKVARPMVGFLPLNDLRQSWLCRISCDFMELLCHNDSLPRPLL